ncbi:MAG: cyclodeaminase/cyclohydrolase family protein [Oscillospiraceae bacterium]|nr:cyclodeaminase/cyclohydrolase family protein [Oscillospiraceae bacterium]
MSMCNKSCEVFLDALASKAPVPGGGGAAALVGAVGAALGSMVGNLTVGKQKYADVEEQIIALNGHAEALRHRLTALVDKDAQAFEPLSKAYALPAQTKEERERKARITEHALLDACRVPLEIMGTICEVIVLHKDYAKIGTAIAISDVGVGVACCRAALLGASLNVFINTKSMTDRTKAIALNGDAQAMLSQYIPLADEIFSSVTARFL